MGDQEQGQFGVEYFGNYRKAWKLYEDINHSPQKETYRTREAAERRAAHLRSVWGAGAQFRVVDLIDNKTGA